MSGGQVAWKTSEEAWSANIDVNLSGVWRTAKATIGAMLRRPAPRQGRFIAIASAAGMSGHPTISAYCAAKHGVIGLVQSLAVELGTSGVTANSVCPGSTASGILEASRQVYGLGSLDDFAVHHPIGRILQPEEIASAVSWLASEAQSGVTGIALPVDGGMTI
jgi:NAD(P)-dependent dehydrogenase (short-subunit alcohol dehydrogenase family)